jgi:hypothetical protein
MDGHSSRDTIQRHECGFAFRPSCGGSLMGTWGYGNFEGDGPRDFLADMVNVWERIIDHVLAGEMKEAGAYFGPDATPISSQGQEAIDEIVMPTTEIMIAVAERFECDYLPSPEKVSRWAAEALRVFDVEGVAGWDADPEERRQVIEETFERLSRIVERPADDGPPSESDAAEDDLE